MTTPTAPVIVCDLLDLFDINTLLWRLSNSDAWGYEARREQFVEQAQTAAEATALVCGDFDLGTRCIISGGEVVELDSRRIDTDEPSDEEIPF